MTCDMWLGKWEPVNQIHHCVLFDAYSIYGSGDIKYLLYHMTLSDHMIKGTSTWVAPQPK